ncbi:MAG: hypothetical protein F6K19_25655 [Cyanothece sp. SIO1E1]|nr:hypothetical protein [Cyanothece sp. SIO1E1]
MRLQSIGKFLFDCSYQRKLPEALGFYFVHFCISLSIGLLLFNSLGILGAKSILTAYTGTLASLFVPQKKLSYFYYLLALISAVLLMLGDLMVGLLPALYLATLKPSPQKGKN